MSENNLPERIRRGPGRRWPKGVSGNPGGRPKELREVIDLARAYSADALETLAIIMRDQGAPPAARVSAATHILDRAYGKPKEMVEATVRTTLEDLVMASFRQSGADSDEPTH
jgi:phytoene/squalene synthetase